MRGRSIVLAFTLAIVGVALAACGVAVEQGVGDDEQSSALGTSPTRTPPPTPPWVNEDGSIDLDRVPDLMPVSDRQGNRAGYIRTEDPQDPRFNPRSPEFDPYRRKPVLDGEGNQVGTFGGGVNRPGGFTPLVPEDPITLIRLYRGEPQELRPADLDLRTLELVATHQDADRFLVLARGLSADGTPGLYIAAFEPAPDRIPTCFGAESDPCSEWRPTTALYGPLNDEGPTLEYLGEYVGYVDASPGQTLTYAGDDGTRKSVVIDGPEGIVVLPGAAGAPTEYAYQPAPSTYTHSANDPRPEFEQP